MSLTFESLACVALWWCACMTWIDTRRSTQSRMFSVSGDRTRNALDEIKNHVRMRSNSIMVSEHLWERDWGPLKGFNRNTQCHALAGIIYDFLVRLYDKRLSLETSLSLLWPFTCMERVPSFTSPRRHQIFLRSLHKNTKYAVKTLDKWQIISWISLK